MKKLLYFIFTFILVNLFNFMPALAEDKSYEINKVDINAIIMDNGDINITEYLTYDFLGDFNGFIRDLNSNGSDGCIINSVSIIDKSGIEIIASNENSAFENTYELSESMDKTSIKVYSKSSNEEKTLKVDYTVLNAAKRYESTSGLYWDFYTVENVPYINEVNLNISVNNQILTAENSTYHVFGDGELSTSYINDGININYKNLSSLVGIDLTIPSEFLSNSIMIQDNTSNGNGIEYENNNVSNYGNESGAAVGIIILIVGSGTLATVLIANKNNKYKDAVQEYRSGYDFISNVQYTEPPSQISPALVNRLMGNKNISTEILSSTLFYLCSLGYYNIEEHEYTEKGFYKTKSKYNLIFKRNINKQIPKEEHLKFIITWFSMYESSGKFSLDDIQKVLKDSSEGNIFLKKVERWKTKVESDVETIGFFTTINNRETLTNEFYNENLKWLSYKDYIESSINLKERLNDINTADTMIVYARSLGIDSNLIEKYINELVNVAESSANYDSNSFNNIHYFNYYLLHMNSMNSIYHNVIPNDNRSSIDASGGFTGGSSGGDFGGGGGGGSDAF